MLTSARNAVWALWQDLRYGARLLVKQPGFTVVAVLTLALGVGANTTIFTWIQSTLLTPVPGATGTRNLVAFAKARSADLTPPPLSYLDFRDVEEDTRSFSGLLAYHDDWVTLTGDGTAERVYATLTTANYFDLLGVRPILGRGFVPDEDRQPDGAPVVVISYRLWASRFDESAGALGRTLEINRRPYTIIGVAPRDFEGTKTGLRSDVWIPLVMAEAVWGHDQLTYRDNYWLNVTGRLRQGVDRARAQADLDGVMRDLIQRYPDAHRDPSGIVLYPLWSSPVGANALLHVFLPMLLAISGVVLLLTCANVASLVMVRSAGREHEIAIRRAVGAGGARLLRQFLVEGLLLGAAGAGAALLMTSWTEGALAYFLPPLPLPLTVGSHESRFVLLVAFFLAAGTGIAVSLLPALRTARVGPAVLARESSGGQIGGLHRSRLGQALVVAQISLSVLLLVCAGLFVRSSRLAQDRNPGFDRDGVLLASIDLLPAGYTPASGVEFDRQLLARIQAIPGVEAATMADWVPLSFQSHSSVIEPEGYTPQPRESMEVGRTYAGPDYLRTMRIPLVEGRGLAASDDRESNLVAVVNEELARRYWPGQDALGKRIRAEGRWYTVVGVARQSTYQDPREGRVPFLYLPLLQSYYPQVTLYVRVNGDPLAFTSAVTDAVHAMDANLPVFDVATLAEQTRAAGFRERVAASVVTIFGLLALLLASLGIYGVVASATRQRTREVGVRIALGGTPAEVVRLMLVQGLRLGLAGLLIGLVLALGLTPLLRSQLFETSPADPSTYGGVVAVLIAVAGMACYLPARRAARVDPMRALRAE